MVKFVLATGLLQNTPYVMVLEMMYLKWLDESVEEP